MISPAVSRAQLNVQFAEVLTAWESKAPTSEEKLYALLESPRIGAVDLNIQTKSTGTTLLHEAIARKDTKMIETAIRRGADVYARNRRGKSALESSKDEKIRALLRQFSNADAAIAAQSVPGLPPTFRGYLGKWTNLAGGYKTRWFVLQDGVLSYYHAQEEEGKQSRGSVNLRFAKIRADSNDKHRFEIISEATAKGSSKLFLRGSHPVERARWVQVLQQTQQHFGLERSTSRDTTVAAAGASRRSGSFSTTAPGGATTPGGAGLYNAGNNASVSSFNKVPSRVGTPASALGRTSTNNAILSTTATPAADLSALTSMTAGANMATMTPGITARTPSLISKESARSERDDSDGQADAEPLFDASGKPRIPHGDTYPLVASAMRLKIDLALQLTSSLSAGDSTTSSNDVKAALKDALTQISDLYSQYAMLGGERESYLLRRYEQEIQLKRLWEENMKALAIQHAEMESQLQDAARENARKRKALREVRDNFGASSSSPLGSPSIANPVAQRGVPPAMSETIAERRGSAQATQVGLGATAATTSTVAAGELLDRDDQDENEDDFFDAVESGDLPGLKVETPMAQTPKEENWPERFDKDGLNEAAMEPYRQLRTKLPLGKDDRPSVSLWAILKNNIGKDLTKISFPVSFNEPTSMLQRMAEDMEFSECLDAAATQEDSTKRIAFVAAFAMSNYSSTIGRVAKPFNPLLSETFEYMRPDKHYRYISEQVSHHPPVSACLAQSPLWDYMGCVDAKSKFLGRTFEIRPTGVAHVNLKVPREWIPKAKTAAPAGPPFKDMMLEHFTWNKVTTSVSGFIVGSPTIDHVGDLTVTNHLTGDRCTLTFKPRGWRGGNAREISGQVWDGSGELRWEIAGRWDSQLVARKAGAGRGQLDPDQSFQGDFTAAPQPQGAEYFLLWRNSEKPPMPFNLTPFAITLNDLPPSLPPWLPPTDCRVRPDLVSFEEGRFDEANEFKQSLEDYQRQTRRKRETGELPAHEPRWFTKTVDKDTGETFWKPRSVEVPVGKGGATGQMPEYWSVREKAGQSSISGDGGDTAGVWGSEHIYGPFESKRVKGGASAPRR